MPDESARIPEYRYLKARRASWPEADFVVGNPPFIGNWRMREALGHGYTKVLREVYDEVPETSDFVMYWWHKAALLLKAGELERFGLISTNSLRQTFNRRVVQAHMNGKNPLSLAFAIPDHPWVDESGSADVRIAMTVAQPGQSAGLLCTVLDEGEPDDPQDVVLDERSGEILANLTIGADITSAVALQANDGISNTGVKLHGAGFIVTPDQARKLGLGSTDGLEEHIRHYRNGRDLTATPRGVMVIDLDGLEIEEVRSRFPAVYQWVHDNVKPERDQNRERYRRENWWLFGRRNTELRAALRGLRRYISTVETSKHRFFVFLDDSILPDNKLVNIAIDDAFCLGVLSSHIHVSWALAAGSRLGVGNDPVYVKTTCFESFPFPAATADQQACIRDIAEQLDAHRKDRLAEYDGLTMTGMYNVLERLRNCEELTAKEREIHEQGLVSVLKDLHDQLNRAVLDAYDWPYDMSDEEVLERLVALNSERAAEESQGRVRWLRPSYQNPEGATLQATVGLAATRTPGKKLEKRSWPSKLPDQARALRAAIGVVGEPISSSEAAKLFTGARKDRVGEILETLAGLGQVVKLDDNRYVR